MKKILVLFVLALLCAPVAWGLAGCGPGAEQIAKDTMRASESIDTVRFKIVSTQHLPRAPIQDGKVAKQKFESESSGDINHTTGDLRIQLRLTPEVPVTAMQVGGKLYMQLAGNWYQMPDSFQLPAPVTQALSISQYLKYFKSIDRKRDTRIDGEACFHLQGVPDMKELIKLPGITDLLKDPATGQQLRTVDELADAKAVFDFYVRKKDHYIKQSRAFIEMRAPQDLIRLGYAQAGDRVKLEQTETLSKYNERLNLQAPANCQPWPE